MSSVRLVPAWKAIALPAMPTRRMRRRLLLLVLLAAAAATAALFAGGVIPKPDAQRQAPDAELAAARARAVAKAKANADRKAPAPAARPVASRTADASESAALFASHSWYIAPPPPPAIKPPPPPPPTAPQFPYSFLGSYLQTGGAAVYFLARGDRVVDARVGDRLDGVYEFESAATGQLVFNYLPLNIRQALATGANP